MYVVAGPSNPLLSLRIAKKLNARIAKVSFKKFPDGELYVRVEEVKEPVVLVQGITSNENLIYLFLLLDSLSALDPILVLPYMGYSRQDREFLKGEAVSIRMIAKMIEEYVRNVITVNIHSHLAASYFKKLIHIDAMPLIGEYFKNKDVVMISPDLGSLERVKVAAETAGCEYDYMEKKRIDAERVEIKPKSLDVKEKEVVLVDDIISTGGTLIEATKILRLNGARKIVASCVHAVLASNALNKLYSSGITEVVATDTIERQVSKISVSDLLSLKIEELLK